MRPAGPDAMPMRFSRPGFALAPVTSPMRTSGQRGNASAGKSVAGHLQFIRQGNALDASTYAAMAVGRDLLLGPCYHLPARQDRVAVLQQACRAPGVRRLALRQSCLAPCRLLVGAGASPGAAFWTTDIGPNTADRRHRVSTLSHSQTMADCPMVSSAYAGELPAHRCRSRPGGTARLRAPTARSEGSRPLRTHWSNPFARHGCDSIRARTGRDARALISRFGAHRWS